MRIAIPEDSVTQLAALTAIVTVNPGATSPADVYLASLAPGSRRTMRQALQVIAESIAVGTTIEQVPWHAIRFEHVSAIRAQLADQYAPAMANKVLAALRGVVRAAFGLGMIGADDLQRALSVKGVKGSRLPKGRSIPKVELESLFGVCDPNTNKGSRDAALLALLYAGGMRRAEVVSLDISAFDTVNDTVRIVGKGSKERIMHLTNGARRAVLAWVQRRGASTGPLLTPITQKDAVVERRLSAQSVLDIVCALADRAGVPHLSPHDFRRTFVGDLLDAGVDLATVQGMAAHASPTTTAGYDRRGERTRRRAAETLIVPYNG